MSLRCFSPDYDHGAIARWLRLNAAKGFNRGFDEHSKRYLASCSCGVCLPAFPNSVSLIFTRDAIPSEPFGWHLSVCCVTETGYRGYVPEEGEHWAGLLFGPYRGQAIMTPLADRTLAGKVKDVRHWRLDCRWGDSDPVVNLEGL